MARRFNQAAATRLLDIMHNAHEEGHEADDNNWNGYGGYGLRR